MSILDSYPLRPVAGWIGQVLRNDLEEQAVNAEASAEIAFGKAVILDTVDARTGVKLPSANNQVIRGIAYRMHDLGTPEEYGTVGVKAGIPLRILRKGRIMLPLEVAVTVRGTRGFVQAIASTGRTVGTIQPNADSTNTIDTTVNISIETLGGIGDLVEVEVDFTREQ